MIRGVFIASVGLHVVVLAALPDAAPLGIRPLAPASVIEVANDPPPAPPAPEPPSASPAEAPSAPSVAKPSTRGAPAARTATASAALGTDGVGIALPAGDVTEVPADFTGTVLSNAGPGGPAKVVSTTSATLPARAPEAVRMVPLSSLSRRPRAPALDAELERNYPVEARRAGISGTAKLKVQILSDGRVGKIDRLSESNAGFGDACMRTVRAAPWEAPLDEDGKPVATEITYVCKFEVRS